MKTNEIAEFDDELFHQIKVLVKKAKQERPPPYYAAFDADGTLWSEDAGETFFKYQIAHCQLKGLPKDPWKHYHDLKEIDPPASCLWLAQINRGQSLEQVREWAQECYAPLKSSWPIYQSQKRLIEFLKQEGVQVFIVTASIKWAVEPLAELLGLDHHSVLGIEVTEEDDLLTAEGVYPLPYGDGKPKSLLKHVNSVNPIFAAGNTYSDSYLVKTATHAKLACMSAKPGEGNHETEEKMKELALSRQWLVHQFYK